VGGASRGAEISSASRRFSPRANASPVFPRGITKLDHLTSGFNRRAADPRRASSNGKNSAGAQYRGNVAVRGNKPVAIFSLEMSKESLLAAPASSDAQIDSPNSARAT